MSCQRSEVGSQQAAVNGQRAATGESAVIASEAWRSHGPDTRLLRPDIVGARRDERSCRTERSAAIRCLDIRRDCLGVNAPRKDWWTDSSGLAEIMRSVIPAALLAATPLALSGYGLPAEEGIG